MAILYLILIISESAHKGVRGEISIWQITAEIQECLNIPRGVCMGVFRLQDFFKSFIMWFLSM